MKNNIYGIIGIESVNANWNADFEGRPKTDGSDNIKGTSYSLQYCMKELWRSRGEKVFGLKERDSKNEYYKTQPKKYEDIFGKNDKSLKYNEVFNNLIQFKDILNFGVVFTGLKGEGSSFSLKGTVQIQDGLNKFEGTEINVETILSPYASGEKKNMTTNGVKITTNEAHYLYPLSVIPNQYNYEEKDYEDFKDVSLKAVTLYNSKAKAGCKNEFGLFVKVKEEYNYQLALSDLTQYVSIKKEDNKVIYDLTELNSLLSDCKNKIESIELYYRGIKNKVIGFEKDSFDNVKIYDIITGKEI